MPDEPPERRAVLLLGRGNVKRQMEIVQAYCEQRGYRVVATTRDIHAAVRLLEEGEADRVVVASRTYMPTPAFEIVTRDLPKIQDDLKAGRHRRPWRLRKPEDPPTDR